MLRTALLAVLAAQAALAVSVSFNFYVDDYATVRIDNSLVGSYNNSAAAGNIIFTDALTPGWHDIAIDYANQAGTNFLNLDWQYPGDPGLSLIPQIDLRSFDQSGAQISGLKADYYDSLGGNYQFTVYGEGPIDNGALSFTSEVYQGSPGLWAGTFGPSSLFEERLSGQILISASTTPEPSTALVVFVSLVLLVWRGMAGPISAARPARGEPATATS